MANERVEAARAVTRSLVTQRTFRDSIPPLSSGVRHIMAASLDDPMNVVFEEISRVGTPLALCVRVSSGSMTTVIIKTLEPGQDHHDPHGPVGVHPEAHVGMFIACVWENGGTAVFHMADALDYQLELV